MVYIHGVAPAVLHNKLWVKGMKMDSIKTNAIRDWPVPKRVKDIQQFLGLANFYHQFIEELQHQ
jgi:hypothetical protein